MQAPNVFSSVVVLSERLAESVYAVTVACPQIAAVARAGLFLNIKCGAERLLRRPISICGVDGDKLRVVFEKKGAGTEWLSGRAAGERLDVLGPLGNGFDIPEGKIIVVGGGIGAPPLLFAAESAKGAVTAVLGFRDSSKVILKDEFEKVCGKTYITTDDGSSGIHGTAALPLTELLEKDEYAAVLACGPRAMMSAVAGICMRGNVSCQVSLEERMGCGVGACVVCACATVINGVEKMSRVCKDGPVFPAHEVIW